MKVFSVTFQISTFFVLLIVHIIIFLFKTTMKKMCEQTLDGRILHNLLLSPMYIFGHEHIILLNKCYMCYVILLCSEVAGDTPVHHVFLKGFRKFVTFPHT